MSEQNKSDDRDLNQKLEQAMVKYEQAVQDGVITKEDEREERIRTRAMRSSTFKAIAALEEVPPEEWGDELLEEVIEDVVAIDRVRWFEREMWMLAAVVLAVGAFVAGWYLKPEPKPEPVQWNCTVEFDGSAGERREVDCNGVSQG